MCIEGITHATAHNDHLKWKNDWFCVCVKFILAFHIFCNCSGFCFYLSSKLLHIGQRQTLALLFLWEMAVKPVPPAWLFSTYNFQPASRWRENTKKVPETVQSLGESLSKLCCWPGNVKAGSTIQAWLPRQASFPSAGDRAGKKPFCKKDYTQCQFSPQVEVRFSDKAEMQRTGKAVNFCTAKSVLF